MTTAPAADNIEKGRRVFTENGTEAEYVGAAGDSHVIQYVVNGDDGEFLDDPRICRRVFLNPPVQKIADEYATINEKLIECRRELWQSQKDLSDWRIKTKERMEEISRHKQLDRLADFLEGKITHVVISDWSGISIQTFEEAFSTDEGYGAKGVKLLCLFGKPHNGLEWMMNSYKDGSGSYTQVAPFTSYEDAAAHAKQLIAGEFEKYRSGASYARLSDKVKGLAAILGLEIPEDVVLKDRSAAKAIYIERLKSLEAEAEKNRSALALIGD